MAVPVEHTVAVQVDPVALADCIEAVLVVLVGCTEVALAVQAELARCTGAAPVAPVAPVVPAEQAALAGSVEECCCQA